MLSPAILSNSQLLGQVAAVPATFTPNGDGVNEGVVIQYNLLSLSAARPVEVALYDLAGQRVRTLFSGLESNGRYVDKIWDGRDDSGQRVPPGLYLARVEVKGDSGTTGHNVVVGVAY